MKNDSITITTHQIDLRNYPIENHADLLMFYHLEFQAHEPLDTDFIRVTISPIQLRMLRIELNVQLAENEDYGLMPAMELKGVEGWPVEVRE